MKKYVLAHPWLIAFAAISGGLLQGLIAYTSLIIGDIIDAVSTGDQERFFSYVILSAILVPVIWLLGCLSIRMIFAYGEKSKRTLQKDFFDSVLDTSISDFNQESSAKYIAMLNNDIDTISGKLFSAVPQFTKDGLTAVFSVVAMVIISPVNAALAIATAALPLVAPMLYSKRLAQTQLEVSARNITFIQKIKDYFSGFEVIKTFGVESNIRPKFFAAANNLMRARYKAGTAIADVGALTIAIVMGIRFLNYFVAGYFVLRGDITIGGVIALVSLSSSLLQPMTLVSDHITGMKSIKDISKRVLDVINRKDSTLREVKINALDGGIEFKSVSFSYEGAAEGEAALINISYSFKKGGKYAIVGASGSGKSTFAKLIMGYYDNYSGDVLINGHNVREIDREGLYSVVSAQQQNVFLLDDTLRNNVTLYNNYSDAEYRAALEKANLLDVEARLANGSDTVLGEGGNTISGGERQRISIARAILKGSDVMVLDEATASLDNIVAHEIEKSIVGMAGITCIFVTHRYTKDILQSCDGILVMENGALVEAGTFDELVDCKGCFFNLLGNV